MADKDISSLPLVDKLTDDAMIPVKQSGKASRVSGVQFKAFAQNAVTKYISEAKTAADEAASSAQTAAESVAQIGDAVAMTAANAEAAQKAREDAEKVIENAATDTANTLRTEMSEYVMDAQAARDTAQSAMEAAMKSQAETELLKEAAEQARDEAQSIAGGSYLPLAGGTLTGYLSLSGDPTTALHAVPKQYVDGLVGGINQVLDSLNGEVV